MEGFEIDSSHVGSSVSDAGKAKVLTRPNPLFYSAIFIIVTEFCERVAYYGFAGSLVLFFQQELDMSNADADVQFSVWSGMAYCTPLLGGFVADKYLGRYWTILVFSAFYLLGLVIVVFGADPKNINEGTFFFGMYVIALGTGGIKPNVSTLGADQYDDRYPAERKGKESFFNYFYWSINLGACFSYTFVAYVCQYGIKGFGGDEYSFVVGYSVPTVMMALAIGIFLYGTPRYAKKEMPTGSEGSKLEQSVKICYEALWTRRTMFDAVATPHRLDLASTAHGGSFKDNDVACVKLLARITPFLSIMIMFWGIYSQMSTAFQNQGCQMDVAIGTDGAEVPVSALQMFDTIAILIFVPLFDYYLFPYLKSKGIEMDMLTKISWGFVFAAAAMLMAGFVEAGRLANARSGGGYLTESAITHASSCVDVDDFNPYQFQKYANGDSGVDKPFNCEAICNTLDDGGDLSLNCIKCDDIPQQSELSIMAQIPQFLLIGVSEILSSISSLEFFYSQAPSSMRSVSQSVNLFTTALGAWIIIPLIYLVNAGKDGDKWVPEDLDKGHLDLYFYLLALLMVGNWYVLRRMSAGYEYVKSEDLERLESDDWQQPHSGASSTDDSEAVTSTDKDREVTNPLVKVGH
jgi:peptide/histidine transporter 3/4